VGGMPGGWQGQAPGGSAGEPVSFGIADRSLWQVGCQNCQLGRVLACRPDL